MISKELINELHQIILDDYGVNLRKEQAEELANTLVKFFEILLYTDNCKNDK